MSRNYNLLDSLIRPRHTHLPPSHNRNFLKTVQQTTCEQFSTALDKLTQPNETSDFMICGGKEFGE